MILSTLQIFGKEAANPAAGPRHRGASALEPVVDYFYIAETGDLNFAHPVEKAYKGPTGRNAIAKAFLDGSSRRVTSEPVNDCGGEQN